MTKTINIHEGNGIEFYYDFRDHIWIYIRLLLAKTDMNLGNHSVINEKSRNFIFDTGAQNTIISKRRAIEFGYVNLPVKDRVSAGGVGGGVIYCSRIEIPEMIITNKLIIHKPAILIPDDANVSVNILGQDILKPYSYYLDAKRQYIYFDLENI